MIYFFERRTLYLHTPIQKRLLVPFCPKHETVCEDGNFIHILKLSEKKVYVSLRIDEHDCCQIINQTSD